MDYFLRKIWVECCGHLSAFTIEGERYAYQPLDELEESGMDGQLSRVLQPGTTFTDEYDYGSTTEFRMKVVGFWDRERKGTLSSCWHEMMHPKSPASNAGSNPQRKSAPIANGEGEGWLCEDCADEHECGSEMFLPVVNSPRAGVALFWPVPFQVPGSH